MFLPTGSLQDEETILARARLAFAGIRQLSERNIPLPSAIAENSAVVDLIKDKIINVTQRGSRMLWTARIWELSL
jgi:hypothetical protein